jgi:RNA polymerase sigma factor (TIGR02999 family)
VSGDVTRILSAIEKGDAQAAEQLLPLVYGELRRLAAQRMAQENPGQTLQATALVHEAYVRLADRQEEQHWDSRGHFFAAAAEAMRRILVDRAREKGARKRGGDRQRVPFDSDLALDTDGDRVLDLHDALAVLETHDAEAAKLVKLRYFAGIPHTQAAELMGISRRSADRLWTLGRTWLYRQMSEG